MENLLNDWNDMVVRVTTTTGSVWDGVLAHHDAEMVAIDGLKPKVTGDPTLIYIARAHIVSVMNLDI